MPVSLRGRRKTVTDRVQRPASVLEMAWLNFPSFLRQRAKSLELESWVGSTFEKPDVYRPKNVELDDEYEDLAERAVSPWGGLIVTSIVQTMFLEGIRRPKADENMEVWDIWLRNRWNRRQNALHRAAVTSGLAFGASVPGIDPMSGERTVMRKAFDSTQMAAFYNEPDDEWPRMALQADTYTLRDDNGFPTETGWNVVIWDENVRHFISCKGDGEKRGDWVYKTYEEHGSIVPPVVMYAPRLDLKGLTVGEIEPLIPLFKRIDQDTFDRLIVQRFGAWKIRYIAGLAKPKGGTEAERAQAMKLLVQDLLIAENPQAKFGTLEETQLDGFIAARDADLRDLAALSQTPPHHLLGLSSNLQAEALAAAEAGLMRKSGEFRTGMGESHEQHFRLDAYLIGNREEAKAFNAQARWRDMESRSLAQAADALSKLHQGLDVPQEMLWERIPNWTDSDTERAKDLIETGAIDTLLAEIERQAQPNKVPVGQGGDNPAG